MPDDPAPTASVLTTDTLSGRPLTRGHGPLYRQLASALREPIASGAWPVGTALPREADLAGRFGVSLITVRQALRELEADGVILKRPAKPAVVAEPGHRGPSAWDFRSFADLAAFTRGARLEVRRYGREASAAAARAFGLGEDAPCYCLRGVLVAGGRPLTQVTTFFPEAVGRRLARADFDDVLIFRSVQRHLGLDLAAARLTVRAERADKALARELDYEKGAPVLAVELLFRDRDGQPVELTLARYPADRFALTYDLPNDGAAGMTSTPS